MRLIWEDSRPSCEKVGSDGKQICELMNYFVQGGLHFEKITSQMLSCSPGCQRVGSEGTNPWFGSRDVHLEGHNYEDLRHSCKRLGWEGRNLLDGGVIHAGWATSGENHVADDQLIFPAVKEWAQIKKIVGESLNSCWVGYICGDSRHKRSAVQSGCKRVGPEQLLV